ncbi:MAG: DNA repair protein RadA, partial [Clostridia bacterium]|nr:DNA repair protein RadA [Clostridia bacterium]
YYNVPRRVTNGIDLNRLNMILAVIEKVCGISLGAQDVYVNVVGGIKITEPASDLAVAMAVISSYKSVPVKPGSLFIGELALTGEIRSVVNVEKRIKEAVKLGFTTIYTTKYGLEKITLPKEAKIVKVNNIKDLVKNIQND